MVHKSEHTILTTNGEGEHGAATARLKLEPDGGSPNKYGCRIAGSLWERKGTRSTGKGVMVKTGRKGTAGRKSA